LLCSFINHFATDQELYISALMLICYRDEVDATVQVLLAIRMMRTTAYIHALLITMQSTLKATLSSI
jgi:hypothetical protein